MWLILGLTVFSIVLGVIWYGPVFGKKFSWANDWPDFSTLSEEEQVKAKKAAMPYYGFQAAVTFLQMMVLGWFVDALGRTNALETAFWLWLGFILPLMAGNVIWSMQPSHKKRFTLLGIGIGYQLVLMLVAGYVLSLKI